MPHPETKKSVDNTTADNEGPKAALADIHRLQLQQAIETYRMQLSLMVQINTIMIVGNVSVTGFAFHEKSAAVVGVGAVFPLAMIYLGWTIFKLSVPLLYYAVKVEQISSADTKAGLISTFLGFTQSTEYLREMQSIARSGTLDEQLAKLKRIKVPSLRGMRIHGRLVLLGVAVAEIALSIALNVGFHWEWFGK